MVGYHCSSRIHDMQISESEGQTMRNGSAKPSFACDYMEGAHPAIMKKLMETNEVQTAGYGLDPFSESARQKIREACGCPEGDVYFLVGGTQTNAAVIGALLKPYQGVLAADTGHIGVHEAGAIEAGGHKVLTLRHTLGKISPGQVRMALEEYDNDVNHDHTVMPGMVYVSHPTEYGTLYSRDELRGIGRVCREYGIPFYLDGARLAYALACPENDVTLKDLAELCDAFYIGGTKCGALFGEAVVMPRKNTVPHFISIVKQNGALLAKGRMLGIQFDVLFTDGLYERIGKSAVAAAQRIQRALAGHGHRLCFETPTNQVFCIFENEKMRRLAERMEFGFWEKYDETHSVVRFVTSWATPDADVEKMVQILSD